MKKTIFFFILAAGLAGCNRSPEFYFKRANYLVSVGKDSQALENYNKAVLLQRSFPEALTARGMFYERQGDKQKAGLDYSRSIDTNPAYLPAYNNMAALLMDEGNYKGAVEVLDKALAASPGYSYALLNRGLSYYKLNNCGAASEDLTRAINLNPKFELAFYHRALCAKKASNITAALTDLDSVLTLNPAAAMAWFERGKIKYAVNDFAGASLDFAKAVELKPEGPAMVYWHALGLYKTGAQEAALESALRALDLKTDSYQAAGLIGDIYAAMYDVPKAREYYLKAAELAPKYSAYYKARIAAAAKAAARR
ncbi:MAG TPA: hypothetical protein DCZ92_14235 [Elusimicrobia bacterium]|nr:MAG: hypothetical protein A2016_08825 [Elusimicrobia bacterium GWF2_62_30]HBA61941.1 hypothetical protein [Elusimicrobiota bacterium]